MIITWPVHATMILGLFALGAVVGSFLNVCIYRIPWEKSVIWPASHCPKCWQPIAPQDNVPVLSWLALRGECRRCGEPIAGRYAGVEFLVGLLFASVYVTDVIFAPTTNPWGDFTTTAGLRVLYHTALVALLVVATFIDYDHMQIPDQVTVPGIIVGLGLGTLFPDIRLSPSTAATARDGFLVGITGLFAGAALTELVRLLGGLAFRGEAMGFGDVTLMAMIGSFLGWQAAVLTFFLGPFFGLARALAQSFVLLGKRLRGVRRTAADHEMPFGPYLSMAAVALMLSWPWFWPNRAKPYFDTLRALFLNQ